MNTRILSIIGLVILGVALFFGGLFWGSSQANALSFYPGSMMNGGFSATQDGYMNTPQNGYGMMDGSFGIASNGMMGGYGGTNSGYDMMGGNAGMMGGYGETNSGYGMMGGMIGNASGLINVDPLTLKDATTAVTDYLASLNNDNLELGEIMIFSNHAYAQILDADTYQGAFEVLVDAATRTVFPEPGPNMMWNSEYGMMVGFDNGMMGMMGSGMMNGQYGSDMMSGQYDSDMMSGQYNSDMMGSQYGSDMMGDYGYAPDAETSVTSEQAVELAQAYLDDYLPGKTADEHADAFPGYYTLHILEDGQTVGMLSVNAATSQVFPHYWHGDFIEMAE